MNRTDPRPSLCPPGSALCPRPFDVHQKPFKYLHLLPCLSIRMTTRKTLLIGLAAALVVSLAIPAVLAQGANSSGSNHSAGQGRSDAGSHMMNATEREARHAELKAARESALASFHENRSAALKTYHDALNATRQSFLENKTRVLEACQAARNATTGNESNDHCVRDGLRPLIQDARADIRDAQEAFRASMLAAREHAKAAFASHRHDINVKHGQPDA